MSLSEVRNEALAHLRLRSKLLESKDGPNGRSDTLEPLFEATFDPPFRLDDVDSRGNYFVPGSRFLVTCGESSLVLTLWDLGIPGRMPGDSLGVCSRIELADPDFEGAELDKMWGCTVGLGIVRIGLLLRSGKKLRSVLHSRLPVSTMQKRLIIFSNDGPGRWCIKSPQISSL